MRASTHAVELDFFSMPEKDIKSEAYMVMTSGSVVVYAVWYGLKDEASRPKRHAGVSMSI